MIAMPTFLRIMRVCVCVCVSYVGVCVCVYRMYRMIHTHTPTKHEESTLMRGGTHAHIYTHTYIRHTHTIYTPTKYKSLHWCVVAHKYIFT